MERLGGNALIQIRVHLRMPMIRRFATIACATLLAGLGACGEPDPEIHIAISDIPSMTSDLSIEVEGQVVRSPVDHELTLTVTVTGGAQDVSAVASLHGIFSLEVPLLPNTTNELVFVADDGIGNLSRPEVRTVAQSATSLTATKGETP